MTTIEPGQTLYTAVEVVPDAYSNYRGDEIEAEYPVTVGDSDGQVLFTSEDAAEQWLSENGMITQKAFLSQRQAELDAEHAKELAAYARALKRHEKALRDFRIDHAQWRDLIDRGVPTRLMAQPVEPAAPTKPAAVAQTAAMGTSMRYYRVDPVTFIA